MAVCCPLFVQGQHPSFQAAFPDHGSIGRVSLLGQSSWVWTGKAVEGCGSQTAVLWCLLTSPLLSLAGFMYSFETKRSILNQQYLAALRQIAVVFLTNWNTMAPFLIISSSSVLFLLVSLIFALFACNSSYHRNNQRTRVLHIGRGFTEPEH